MESFLYWNINYIIYDVVRNISSLIFRPYYKHSNIFIIGRYYHHPNGFGYHSLR